MFFDVSDASIDFGCYCCGGVVAVLVVVGESDGDGSSKARAGGDWFWCRFKN